MSTLFGVHEDRSAAYGFESDGDWVSLAAGDVRFVLEGVEAWDNAVVASRGRADRMIDEERFGGMEEGDSSGMGSAMSTKSGRW